MTWCPPSSSSVSKARFVTVGAISMKLGVRIPFLWAIRPEIFLIFAIRPILWPPGHLENQTFAI
jgi:hypothetical protein